MFILMIYTFICGGGVAPKGAYVVERELYGSFHIILKVMYPAFMKVPHGNLGACMCLICSRS